MCMSYILCCVHAVLSLCIVYLWYHDMCIHCVLLYICICVVSYTISRCMYCVVVELDIIQDEELKALQTHVHGCAYVTLCNGSIRLQNTQIQRQLGKT